MFVHKVPKIKIKGHQPKLDFKGIYANSRSTIKAINNYAETEFALKLE